MNKTTRNKPLPEQVQEAVNRQTAEIARRGLEGIDHAKREAVKRLEKEGIVGIEEIADSTADLIKKLLIRGLSK